MSAKKNGNSQLEKLASLLLFESRLRAAATEVELAYIAVNDTLGLVSASTAVLWRWDEDARPDAGKVFAISSAPFVDARSPFAQWSTRFCRAVARARPEEVSVVQSSMLPEDVACERAEHVAREAVWVPLELHSRQLGALVLWRDQVWTEAELRILQHWSGTLAHSWHALRVSASTGFRGGLRRLRRPGVAAAAGLLLLSLLLPLRLSVLAPAELQAADTVVVRSPMQGVIEELHVQSNREVNQGQLLLKLDDTSLRTELEVATQELEIARAQFRQSSQAAAHSEEAKAELQVLRMTLEKYVARINYLNELLARTRIVAEKDAIAIVDASDEMVGRPVQLGERLLTLVDGSRMELELWLPVGDDITLEPGAEVEFFPNVAPHEVYRGTLLSMDYHARLSPVGTLAYRVQATIEVPPGSASRMGMRGTGKLYGERVSLFYYLFRRPLSFLRQSLGL